VQSGSAIVVRVRPRKGEQSDLPGLLDSRRDRALMSRARAGLPARADPPVFAYIFAKQVGLLVINNQRFICAELTEFGFRKETAFAALAAFRRSALFSFFSHV